MLKFDTLYKERAPQNHRFFTPATPCHQHPFLFLSVSGKNSWTKSKFTLSWGYRFFTPNTPPNENRIRQSFHPRPKFRPPN
jgi:hypothetical protein